MHKIFIDSDIILDVLAQRNQFYAPAARLLTAIVKGRVAAFTSPLVIANTYYLLSKIRSKKIALQSIKRLKVYISVLSMDESAVDFALNSLFSDFEDALQYYTAKSHDINFIITRNKKDFKRSKISVCTAEEYLKILNANTL